MDTGHVQLSIGLSKSDAFNHQTNPLIGSSDPSVLLQLPFSSLLSPAGLHGPAITPGSLGPGIFSRSVRNLQGFYTKGLLINFPR